mgnify:CR=1 FL=1
MSNFKKILKTHKESHDQSTEESPLPSPAPQTETVKAAKNSTSESSGKPAVKQKKLGRPSGKRSDSDYVQVTGYIREKTHVAVKIALLKKGKGQEFSELLEELLSTWLKSSS